MCREHAPATILCVEDEEFILEELEEELSSRGYRVLTALNGDQAESLLADYRPDIVLCDVMLPGRSGVELLTNLRASGKLAHTTAFIFLTALSDRDPHGAGLRRGANDYLTKPIDLDLLHLKIENILTFSHRLRDGVAAADAPRDVHLSRREEQVLTLLGQGERTGAIASRLEISEHTVNHYIKELYRKLGINNRADAARVAISLGLVGRKKFRA